MAYKMEMITFFNFFRNLTETEMLFARFFITHSFDDNFYKVH